jgi:hypothetical protein
VGVCKLKHGRDEFGWHPRGTCWSFRLLLPSLKRKSATVQPHDLHIYLAAAVPINFSLICVCVVAQSIDWLLSEGGTVGFSW